jgi:hypothetical protein
MPEMVATVETVATAPMVKGAMAEMVVAVILGEEATEETAVIVNVGEVEMEGKVVMGHTEEATVDKGVQVPVEMEKMDKMVRENNFKGA